MRTLIHWMSLPALACGSAQVYAVSYLTVDQAQEAIFPGKQLASVSVKLTSEQRKLIERNSGVRVRNLEPKIWAVESGGWFILDEVIGKHEFITYALGLADDGTVKAIEVMDYRETYGGQVRDPKWRAQFTGKKPGATLKLDDDILNISGATLSCRHITDGVKRLLATYDLVLKK